MKEIDFEYILSDDGFVDASDLCLNDCVLSYDLETNKFLNNRIISRCESYEPSVLFTIETGDSFYLPADSYLLTSGGKVRADKITTSDYLQLVCTDNLELNTYSDFIAYFDIIALIYACDHINSNDCYRVYSKLELERFFTAVCDKYSIKLDVVALHDDVCEYILRFDDSHSDILNVLSFISISGFGQLCTVPLALRTQLIEYLFLSRSFVDEDGHVAVRVYEYEQAQQLYLFLLLSGFLVYISDTKYAVLNDSAGNYIKRPCWHIQFSDTTCSDLVSYKYYDIRHFITPQYPIEAISLRLKNGFIVKMADNFTYHKFQSKEGFIFDSDSVISKSMFDEFVATDMEQLSFDDRFRWVKIVNAVPIASAYSCRFKFDSVDTYFINGCLVSSK